MNRTTDRIAEYYGLAATHIALDMLGFYTRAEKGRRVLAHMRSLPSRFDPPKAEPVFDPTLVDTTNVDFATFQHTFRRKA